MNLRERAWAVLRVVYGLFFFVTGIWIWLHILTGRFPPPVQPTPEAAAFMSAFDASGFMEPLLGLTYLIGGGALLVRRTAPLGLVVLAPSVAVIFFFDLLLAGQTFWPLIVASWFAALAWRLRAGLRPLVQFAP
jgi:hypothetical protein